MSDAATGRAMTVRNKLVLLTGLLLGGISAFIYLYFPGRTEERLLRAVAAQARDISRIAAFSAAPALYFGDPTSGLESLKGADATTDVAYVVIADANGKVFAAIHEDRARLARYREAFSAGGITPDGSVHRAALPILHEGRRIGTLYAGLSLAPVRAEIASMHRTIGLVSALVFALGLLVAIAIGAFVTRPLNEMVQTTRAIACGERRRAPLRALDEVGELAVSFNSMLDALDGARSDLEQLNRNLEQRVAERTIDLQEEIQERQRGEDALRRANERFVLAAGAVNGAIYDRDMVEETILWTDGLTRVFGYPLEEVAPTTDWWLTRIHPDDANRVGEQLRQAFEVGRDFVSEYRFRAKDGTEFHVWDRGRVVRDGKGAVRMVGLMESVTELKRLEEQYRQAQKMEAVGQLAGGVAHDFNNMLTTILGYSHLILGNMEPDDPQRLDVEEIRKAGDRAAALTKQLLAFSRKQVIEPKVLEVNAVVANMEKMLCRLIGEDIQCRTELDSSAGYIRADLGQLEQVIMNIVVNARDAMPQRGRLTITTGRVVFDDAFLRQHVGSRPGPYASIVLSDTGCGMDPLTKSRIFEPFYTTKGPHKGTGLGMATVYGIVKQSEGYIVVESDPGEGTRISLYFPRLPEEALPLDSLPSALPSPRGSEIVLLVEDEDAVRTLVRGVLRSRGYTVLEASNATDASRISHDFEGAIDILLTDVVMPDVSGRELADQLRVTRPDMRLLYMSGYTEDRVVHHGVMTSDVGFLQKPFTPESLLRKMRETLDRRHDGVVM